MIANLLLLLTAALWGFGFIAQVLGMEHLEPFAFNGYRFIVGAISLLPLLYFYKKKNKLVIGDKRSLMTGAVAMGVILFIAATFQQVGLLYTTAANAGFITGLYIVIVPIFGLALKHSTGLNTWLGCLLAVVGLYFLSVSDDLSIGYGDSLQLAGAVFWACHILVIDHYSVKHSPLVLAFIQFVICGILSLMTSFVIETTTMANVIAAGGSLLYGGVVSVGIAYTIQIVAQKKAHPSHAAIILSLEAVFAAIGGMWILNQMLSEREMMGCGFMLLGMLISQVPLKMFKKKITVV
ncbi:DMT family transporter [Parashewanella spongiae]|uniref:DMT family transporter n=1 Tax=Parashewanella spongiae TaxID=342950 RepID=A0A3A6T6W9_9GAMM|nr:DMT family transporter [Parashewanella spongiae]MCL1080117.1 DMT family transporter [Parashewanella spongiae]RJY07079.1 DMT family transporter [Parashewanella spongiae]